MSHRGPVFVACLVAALSGCVAAPISSNGSISVVGRSDSVAPWPTTGTTPGSSEAATGTTAGSAAAVVPGTVVPAAPVTVSTTMPAEATTSAAAATSWITLVSCVYDEATGMTQGTWSYYGASATSAYTATVAGLTHTPMTVGRGPGNGYAKAPGKGSCSATITS